MEILAAYGQFPDMELTLTDNPAIVSGIVEKTIQNVYPHYYPSGAVQFFLDLHSEVRIGKVMPVACCGIFDFAGISGKRIWKQIDVFTGSKDFGKLSKGSCRCFFPGGEYIFETRVSDYFV